MFSSMRKAVVHPEAQAVPDVSCIIMAAPLLDIALRIPSGLFVDDRIDQVDRHPINVRVLVHPAWKCGAVGARRRFALWPFRKQNERAIILPDSRKSLPCCVNLLLLFGHEFVAIPLRVGHMS
jgi:hypothetical protein